jgi:hypothetical protein
MKALVQDSYVSARGNSHPRVCRGRVFSKWPRRSGEVHSGFLSVLDFGGYMDSVPMARS